MSQQQEDEAMLSVDQRDLPPGLHLKAVLAAAVLLAAVAFAAIRYFL